MTIVRSSNITRCSVIVYVRDKFEYLVDDKFSVLDAQFVEHFDARLDSMPHDFTQLINTAARPTTNTKSLYINMKL